MSILAMRANSPSRRLVALALGAALSVLAAAPAVAQMASLTTRLNEPWQRVSESNKSWKPVLTAYGDLTPPPKPFGPEFNQAAIWPGMQGWADRRVTVSVTNFGPAKGIDVREIACFGDDENDREMLEAAGYGVAMGHAPDTVKAVADAVIGSNDGESLAAALDALV